VPANNGIVYTHPGTGDRGGAVAEPLGPGTTPRAVAVTNALVYRGSSDGNLYAFDAASGAIDWSAPTGYRIYSSAAVSGGRVFVGSANDSLYAFDAISGPAVELPLWEQRGS
jgi:outer membrane protein assembly factor BamB